MIRDWMATGLLMMGMFLQGCSSVSQSSVQDIAASPWAVRSSGGLTPLQAGQGNWQHHAFPGKATTQFRYVRVDGRDALAAVAASSASMLRRKIRIEPEELEKVRFSWRVPELIAGADLASRDADDSPVRIILAFEGDRSRWSARDS